MAQQAQLLVTGDATALAQVQLEEDRRKFFELQAEWERRVASLRSQLDASEEQTEEARSGRAKLREENRRLEERVEEVTLKLSTKEEAQAQREALLEKHLELLQASQDRERRSLATSLKQAEQRANDLQERLGVAEEQLLTMNKAEAWAMEMERAKEELQEELRGAGSDVEKLQEEREQLRHRCQELQDQLSDADREMAQLERCLKTKEMHNYSLQSSYEEVCEELQGALRKAQQKETETQDMREGYKKVLDRKEQELCEVLLKMEVLGNSLEETEVKLNELLSGGGSASPQLKGDPERQIEGHKGDSLVPEDPHRARFTSCSSDSTYQDFVGEDQERFMSVIQVLESKLYLTEEKLRDITQRLEEHQTDLSCQDPSLCSQLTQSRASSQHLSLLLHAQAKENQRFAQETETCCRLLAGRFQVALNIVQACRERLRLAPAGAADLEKQLATVAACLQQGEGDAARLERESCGVSRAEGKILGEEPEAAAEVGGGEENVQSYLEKEIFVVGHMVSALQSGRGVAELFSMAPKDEEGVANQFKSVIGQRIRLKRRKAEYDPGAEVNGAVRRACADAELVYSALKLQRQLQHQRTSAAGVGPSESAPYDQGGGALEGAAAEETVEADEEREVGGEPGWLEGLLSGLKRRVRGLQQLAQEVCEESGEQGDGDDAWKADLSWIPEEARLIYLSERLKSDLEQEGKGSDAVTKEERESWKRSLYGPGEDDESGLGEGLEPAEGLSQKILKDVEEINAWHEKRLRKLQEEFEEKLVELQRIRGGEVKNGHGEEQKGGGDAAEHGEEPQVNASPPLHTPLPAANFTLSLHTVLPQATIQRTGGPADPGSAAAARAGGGGPPGGEGRTAADRDGGHADR